MLGLKLIHVSKRGHRGPIDYNSALVDNGYAQIRQQTLSETMIILFIPAYMRHSVTMCIIEST